MAHESGDGTTLAGEAQLRTAAFLVLAAVLVFFPLQLVRVGPEARPLLLLVFGLHALLGSTVLAVSHTAWGARHADRVGLVFVLGLAANLLLYLYLLPYAVPAYPMLTAEALTFLLIGSAIFLAWRARRLVVVGAAACAGFAIVAILVARRGFPGDPFILALASLVAGAAIAITSAQVLGRFRGGLMRREPELAALSARLMSVQEENWRRLSHELHEELGQSLSAVTSYLWSIERDLPEQYAEMRNRTAEARRLAAETVAQMRELSQLLRPSVLDDYGLVPSLDTYLKAFAERHQITTSFNADGLPERLSVEVETALYRIAQEALTNVARHANASRVRVALQAEGRELRLEVEDDGVGLPARQNVAGMPGTGLIGISERVRRLGGSMSMHSGSGTRLRVRLPVSGVADSTPGPEALAVPTRRPPEGRART